MKTKVLTLIAILLTIPTYGISLIVWIFLKYQYDKFYATRVLINAAVMSFINNGENEVRYGANNAALSMVFSAFNLGYNLYKPKQRTLSDEEKKEILSSEPKSYSPTIQNLLDKETLLSTTDLIIEKYKK